MIKERKEEKREEEKIEGKGKKKKRKMKGDEMVTESMSEGGSIMK